MSDETTAADAGASGPTGAAPAPGYDIPQILAALPHRYPMLLVDRVVSLVADGEIHAIKAVSFKSDFKKEYIRPAADFRSSGALPLPWLSASAASRSA